jgi:glycosyltransferase involved in cell wall biosynthesis
MELSVIIPSLRPLVLKETIERIYSTTKDLNYELIIVSPLDMLELRDLKKVVFVKEKERLGSNAAIELGVQKAKGDYIMELSDDNLVDTDCFKNLVEFMKTAEENLVIASARVHDLWEVHPENTIYGFYYAKTPCIRKSHLNKIQSFYNTRFHCYFGIYYKKNLIFRLSYLYYLYNHLNHLLNNE